jgi:transaldolase
MLNNPLLQLQSFGQSVWLDHFDRRMLFSGELKALIENDGLRGVTSNPAIFDQAFSAGEEYDETIRSLAWKGIPVPEIYEAITVEDVRLAADLFRPLYDESGEHHGFVSLEVNPHLARDTEGTINEARRLWAALDRPNVFIKVPATPEGLPAIQQLIADSINVNVTLLFSLERYRQVAEAYITGLERLTASGRPPKAISVASFFLSRIDLLVDGRLDQLLEESGGKNDQATALRGEIGISAAKQAYQLHRQIFNAERFQKLAVQAARPQQLLWASTGSKDPAYPVTKYVESLIGPDTINTMPPRTLAAYRQQGSPAARLEEGVEESGRKLHQLAELGFDFEQIGRQLEEEGIDKFIRPYDNSLATLRYKARMLREPVA